MNLTAEQQNSEISKQQAIICKCFSHKQEFPIFNASNYHRTISIWKHGIQHCIRSKGQFAHNFSFFLHLFGTNTIHNQKCYQNHKTEESTHSFHIAPWNASVCMRNKKSYRNRYTFLLLLCVCQLIASTKHSAAATEVAAATLAAIGGCAAENMKKGTKRHTCLLSKCMPQVNQIRKII